jgi:hypothetical protein
MPFLTVEIRPRPRAVGHFAISWDWQPLRNSRNPIAFLGRATVFPGQAAVFVELVPILVGPTFEGAGKQTSSRRKA